MVASEAAEGVSFRCCPGLTVHPGRNIHQGEILTVRYESGARLPQGARAEFLAQQAPLFPEQEDRYRAHFGVPVSQTPGTNRLRLLGSGDEILTTLEIEVQAKDYGKQNIRTGRRGTSRRSRGRAPANLKPIPGELEAIAALKTTCATLRTKTAKQK